MIRKILHFFILSSISASILANTDEIQASEDNNSIAMCEAFELSAEQCEILSNYVFPKNSLYSLNFEASNKNPFDGFRTNSFTSGSSNDQTAWFGYKAGGDNGLTCDSSCPYQTI